MKYKDFCYCSAIQIGNGSSNTKRCTQFDCIFAPHMLLHGDLSVNQCDDSTSVLWDEDCLDDCGCGTVTPTFKLISHTPNLKNVTVSQTGITFTSNKQSTGSTAETSMVAEVIYKMSCKRLSTRGSLTIVFNNPCINVDCPIGYVCDECTGDCVVGQTNINSISSQGTGITNISV